MRRRRIERRIELRRISCLLTELVDVQRFALVGLRRQQRRLNFAITDVNVCLPLVSRIFDGRVRVLDVINRRDRGIAE